MLKGSDLVRYEALFRREYHDALGQVDATNLWDQMADLGMEILSTGAEEDYRWLQENPEYEEWIGDRNLSDLAEYEYTIRNKSFQAAVKIFKDELSDDKLNLILPRVRGLASAERRKWGKLMHDLLVNGTTYKAYDAIAFFSDATGSRLNDNLLAGTISAATPTLAQVEADVDTVMQAMSAFVNSRNEVVGVVPDTFVVSRKVGRLFRQVFESSSGATAANAGVINPFKGQARVIVDPGLTDLNDFYALATSYSIGPLVKQKRQDVETVLDASQVNVNKSLFFGADFRGNAGYGLPILAVKVVSGVS